MAVQYNSLIDPLVIKKTFAIFTALTHAFLAYVQKQEPLSQENSP